MKLAQGIKQAYERAWSMVNNFTVQIEMTSKMSSAIGGRFNEEINLNIISITTPDFTNDPIDVFIANKWFMYNGKEQLYRFNITFRDQDQMSLYKMFCKIYKFSKEQYFDDAAMQIRIIKDADWFKENDKEFLLFEGVLIENISNVSFSNNTENQIAEFSVNFRSNKVTY